MLLTRRQEIRDIGIASGTYFVTSTEDVLVLGVLVLVVGVERTAPFVKKIAVGSVK